ncbi:tagaturonate epimerase family protein [Pseudothermotoga thermarum]|uniref:Tagaturonate/fructuronate epimerase n=1 Tax=Pseudothermotoga thermarum DSM 5069 TaxID=688269 RepID=F7YYW9_9THEM|nr:tagaturonate epimerase family protein [Pseudothermotoga thermarum]AEH51163.1 hypothetical protein Theth_1083 [Pseudothermotoga thermarum DSM 5069]
MKLLEEFLKAFPGRFKVYGSSLRIITDSYFFLGNDGKEKLLFVVGKKGICQLFDGQKIGQIGSNDVLMCKKTHENLLALRKIINLNPTTINKKASFGFGDRIGLATPAHAKVAKDFEVFPIFAQQSVRELSRTGRTYKDVLDDAVWGVFESGYNFEFGADADHVKEIEDLEKASNEGFTMYTVDPSDHIKDVSKLSQKEFQSLYQDNKIRRELEMRYVGKLYKFKDFEFRMTDEEFAEIFVTYIDAIEHVCKCYDVLKAKGKPFDFEVSIDETAVPTTPLAHIFIVKELRRRGIDFKTLALRFSGEWQKGIDYIGDMEMFRKEIITHSKISKELGGYKLSLHSGSDKFSVYPIFSEATEGEFHVKTAGTNYLEAIRVVAVKDPELYREIHKFALTKFEQDRKSYHVTTDLSKIPDVDKMKNEELVKLLDMPDSRQLIHITYGSVLTAKDENGRWLFKERILKVLQENEDLHYDFVEKHMRKHLSLLGLERRIEK